MRGQPKPSAASRAKMSKSARARGQTGFLKPQVTYVVTSGGKVRHEGARRRDAERAWTLWRNFARSREGTPQPVAIVLTADGVTIRKEEVK